MKKIYDLIIIGCGGIGSAALYSATKAGLSTLCLEQYEKGHKKGGTHGETRAFRKAYYDNPNYIPLLKKAYQDWKNLSATTSVDLFIENGILEVGSLQSKMVIDAIQCAEQYQIPIEILSDDQITGRFPGFRIPAHMVGIFQPEAGFLRVDHCVNEFIERATSQGAAIGYQEKVLSWKVSANHLVEVKTDKGTYQSRYLIVTTGAWTPELLDTLTIPIKILQKKLVWMSVSKDEYTLQNGTPCFAYHVNDDIFYGFPNIDGFIKVARHNGGTLLAHPNHDSEDDLTQTHDESQDIQQFAKHYLSRISPVCIKQANCLYDMTPDGQFVIDSHPAYPQIAFAAGLSGHGYKMSNVIGELLLDLVTKQSTEFDISFLSVKRFKHP